MPTVFSANSSSILVNGEPVEGIQSLAFRVVTEREDIRAVGNNERIDVSFGLRTVLGELVVRSTNSPLDALLNDRSGFQMVANLAKEVGINTTEETGPTVYAFDECYVEGKSFGLDANSTAVTTYAFTATRVRQE